MWKMLRSLRPHRAGLAGAVALLALLSLSGCISDGEIHFDRPLNYFDAPAANTTVWAGTRVKIQVSFVTTGLQPDEFVLYVQGPVPKRVPLTPATRMHNLVIVTGTWTPTVAGEYRLHAEACPGDDCLIASGPVIVVQEAVQAHRALATTVTPTAAPSPTPTAGATATPWPPTATRPPRPTATPRPRPTATPRPPTPTPDTRPPTITQVRALDSRITWPDCDHTAVVIQAQVQDPGGVAAVQLRFRVHKGDAVGQWVLRPMTLQAAPHGYAVTLRAEDLPASLDPPAYATTASWVEYVVLARDQAGNTAQEPPGAGYRLPISLCTREP